MQRSQYKRERSSCWVTNYMKVRVVRQNPQERNYHIFYCMLAGLSKVFLQKIISVIIIITDFQDQREKLQLREAAHYRYLTGGGSTVCEGRLVLQTPMTPMSTSMSTALMSTSGIVSFPAR